MRWSAVVVAAVALATRATASPLVTDADARDRLAAALVDIEAHMHALRYAEARDAAKAALAIGAATPAEVASLARTLGETNAALDDATEAAHWFTVWLELDPTADLPGGSSPKLTEPLATARETIAEPLAAGLSSDFDGRRPNTFVQVLHDPVAVVAAIEIDGEHHPIAPSHPMVDVSACHGSLTVSLRDRYGNELTATTSLADVPLCRYSVRRRGFWRRPTPYIIASVATAGLGGVFLWRRSVAKDDLADILAHSSDHTFADAESARSRAERHGYLSLASFAAAGAFATVAILFATRPSTEPVIVPTDHGLSVLATTSF